MKKMIFTMGFLATLLTASFMAQAYEEGDVILRLGATQVDPNDDGDPDGVWADDDTQLGINIVYMVANNIGIELLAASPFEHDIYLEGVGVVGSTKHLPPTLSAQYYIQNSSIVTPYVGVGINHTVFFKENLDEIGLGEIELKNSTGFALQVGMDIDLGKKWGVSADVRRIDIDTEVKDSPVKGLEVEIDPWVYSVTAYRKF